MSTPAIQAIGLTKHFRGEGGETVTAVDGIDLTIGSGEIVAFLGPNGAGKTTTLKAICTLLEPHSGTIRVFGQDVIAHSKAVRRRIGFPPFDQQHFDRSLEHLADVASERR